MRKQLLSIFSAVIATAAIAQTPSPSFSTSQNTSFTMAPSANCKFLDVVSANVVWGFGRSGAAGFTSRNYNDFTRTTNAGVTFTTGKVYADTSTYVGANLEGIDANTAWVSSYLKVPQAQGAIHRTTNGGTNWMNMTAPGMYTNAASFCNIVSFVTPSIGITMGDAHAGTANEYEIWRTINGGSTWSLIPGSSIPNPTTGEYGLVNVYTKQGTSNFWFGTNKGRIFRSSDAGLTWNTAVLPGTPTASLNVQDIAFTTPLIGMTTVFNTSSALLEEYITNDGGVTWTVVAAIDPNFGRNDFCAIPGTNIFASCANTPSSFNTGISYSNDGGITWISWNSDAIGYLTIDFADPTSGWVGTFQTATVNPTGGIFKYTGASLAGTVAPTAAFFAPPTICLAGSSTSITLSNVSTGSPTPTYTWSSNPAGPAFSSTSAVSPVITFTTPGTYTISLLANNIFGTNATSQVINLISCVSPTASFTAPTGTLCNLNPYTFTNTSAGSPTPTYSWSTSPSTGVIISPNSTTLSPSISFSTAGVYSVTLMLSNLSGTAQTTQTVNIIACPPIANFNIPSSATNCTLSPITTTNTTSGNGPFSYTWTVMPLGPTFAPNAAVANPSINFPSSGNFTVTLNVSNASGLASISKTISVSTCVGIAENNLLANNIKLYPNPTKDVITVTLPRTGYEYNVIITDILGSVIYNQKTIKNGDAQINLANKAKGVYFITIQGNNEKATKKIVVE